jgi:hypothetical protein
MTIANGKYSVDLWEFNDVTVCHTVSLLRTVSPLHLDSNCDSGVPIHNSKSPISVDDSVSKMLSGTKVQAQTAADTSLHISVSATHVTQLSLALQHQTVKRSPCKAL